MPGAHAHPAEGVALTVGDRPVQLLFHELAVALDRAEWRADVVRECGERAVLGIRRAVTRAEAVLPLEPCLASEPRVLERDRGLIRERRQQPLVGGSGGLPQGYRDQTGH